MAKIVYLTDMDFSKSGYYNISVTTCTAWSNSGHEVKIVGMNYRGEEHNFPFSILPTANWQQAVAQINNLWYLWKFDVLVVAMDIPIISDFYNTFSTFKSNGMKIVGISAMENGPLCDAWAISLSAIDHIMFISQLGVSEAQKVGLKNVSFLPVGFDHSVWKALSPEDKKSARERLGIKEDEFVVITVADNQERKNLWASFSAVAKLGDGVRHIVVTRALNPSGWKLDELARQTGLNEKLDLFNRGMSDEDLAMLYGISDCFLLLSKAEGLGMPILEAMSCGIPVVGTDTGAITELLEDNRGLLVNPAYEFIDVWGNSKRTMADIEDAVLKLNKAKNFDTSKASKFVAERTLERQQQVVNKVLEEVLNHGK